MKNNNRNRKLKAIRAKNAYRKGLGYVTTHISNEMLAQYPDYIDKKASKYVNHIRYKKYNTIVLSTHLVVQGDDYIRNLTTAYIRFKLVPKV